MAAPAGLDESLFSYLFIQTLTFKPIMKTHAQSTRNSLGFIHYLLFILFVFIGLSGCKKDNDPAPAVNFAGVYEVQKPDPKDNYTIIFSKHPTKANVYNVTDLVQILYIPLEVQANGSQLEINKTYTNPSGKQLKITGDGSLAGSILTIQLSVKGTSNYDQTVTAKRKL
jgi:hypothetical protein